MWPPFRSSARPIIDRLVDHRKPKTTKYRRPMRRRLLGAVQRQRENQNRHTSRRYACSYLRWCKIKPDRLTVIDARPRSRHVPLGEAAWELLNSLARAASGVWGFPCEDEPL